MQANEMKNRALRVHAQLRNGLTASDIQKAKKLLQQVNISKVCKKAGVKISTVNNVLRDASPRVGELNKVLIEARRELKRKEQAVKEFPLREE